MQCPNLTQCDTIGRFEDPQQIESKSAHRGTTTENSLLKEFFCTWPKTRNILNVLKLFKTVKKYYYYYYYKQF